MAVEQWNIGTMEPTRIEHDALGAVEVPADRLWGAQTERSRHFFSIGVPRFVWPRRVIRALGLLKKGAALANARLGTLSQDRADLIARAADEVIEGKTTGTRLNYAVPADLLQRFLSGKEPMAVVVNPNMGEKGELGIRLFALGGRKAPAYIDRVLPGSPSAEAGLKTDDLVVSIGG